MDSFDARFTDSPTGVHWAEAATTAGLGAGVYSLRAGAEDDQGPHLEDEVYVVLAGAARFAAHPGAGQPGTGWEREVGPGATLVVPAGWHHGFTAITADVTAVAVYAPAGVDAPTP